MANRVGRLHRHELPNNRELAIRDEVYTCSGCKREFIVEESTEAGYNKSPKKWVELDSTGYAVEYDRTVGGEKFIGRATAETVFDEPGEVTDGQGTSDSSGAIPEHSTGESGGDSGVSA